LIQPLLTTEIIFELAFANKVVLKNNFILNDMISKISFLLLGRYLKHYLIINLIKQKPQPFHITAGSFFKNKKNQKN